jgi:alkylation response protein AidB-like acyl-CoA dehydrogenase
MFFPDHPEHDSMLESMGNFFEQEILPDARKIDQEAVFPRHNLGKLVQRGVMGIPFPQKFGGLGLPLPIYVAALEMLARACANTALQVDVQNMVCEGICLFGNDYQKDRFLLEEDLVTGAKLIAFALTEPCCGSDAKSLQTRAVLSTNEYILNGVKTLITNPGEADFVLVFAKSEKGVSAFIVPADTPGFEVSGEISKLGFRGNKLASIRLRNCAIPVENLLGEEGMGLECAKQILNAGRLSIAAMAVGIAQGAYEKSLSYSLKRKAFGENIAGFQMIQEKLADMITGINAARMLTYCTANLKGKGENTLSEVSQAKLFSSEMALKVCDDAIQIHGGHGYTDGPDIHRHWRDARLLTIGEGTSEMLRLLIAHLALKKSS